MWGLDKIGRVLPQGAVSSETTRCVVRTGNRVDAMRVRTGHSAPESFRHLSLPKSPSRFLSTGTSSPDTYTALL
jgi:hypothetical protein